MAGLVQSHCHDAESLVMRSKMNSDDFQLASRALEIAVAAGRTRTPEEMLEFAKPVLAFLREQCPIPEPDQPVSTELPIKWGTLADADEETV